MSLSRRHFVYVASMSVLAGAASPAVFAQNQAGAAGDLFSEEGVATLGKLSVQHFEWLIGERFSISLAGRPLGKLTLIAATATEPPKSPPMHRMVGQIAQPAHERSLTGFTLRFQGAGGTLPQDTYTFQQGGLGSFPLFIVPENPGSNRTTYLAIFTRLADFSLNPPVAPKE